MGLHVDERQGLFQEEDKQARRHFVLVEFVVVHVGFLSERECGMLEAYQTKT